MADKNLTSENNGIRMGVLTAVVLVVYTGIAALAGFLDKIEAGTLDVVILAAGVVLAIRRFKQVRGNRLSYFQGFSTGIITALTASVLLGISWLSCPSPVPFFANPPGNPGGRGVATRGYS